MKVNLSTAYLESFQINKKAYLLSLNAFNERMIAFEKTLNCIDIDNSTFGVRTNQ